MQSLWPEHVAHPATALVFLVLVPSVPPEELDINQNRTGLLRLHMSSIPTWASYKRPSKKNACLIFYNAPVNAIPATTVPKFGVKRKSVGNLILAEVLKEASASCRLPLAARLLGVANSRWISDRKRFLRVSAIHKNKPIDFAVSSGLRRSAASSSNHKWQIGEVH